MGQWKVQSQGANMTSSKTDLFDTSDTFSVLGSWCSRILRMLDYGCLKIRDLRKPPFCHHHLSLSYDKMAIKWKPILDFSDTQPNQISLFTSNSYIFIHIHTYSYHIYTIFIPYNGPKESSKRTCFFRNIEAQPWLLRILMGNPSP